MATNNISKGELFRRYQLQKSLEYEEEDQNEEQLEFNDQLESGKDGHGEQAFACEEQEAAKTSTCCLGAFRSRATAISYWLAI